MIDLQRIEQLAHTTFDFVREQTKPLLSQISVAASAIFKHFFGLTRQDTKSIRGALENSVPRCTPKKPLVISSDVKPERFRHHLVEQREALLGGQGLVMDEDHFTSLLEATLQAKNPQSRVDFKDGVAIHGIGANASDGLHYMSISIKNSETEVPTDMLLPVMVVKRSSSQNEVASALVELAHAGRQNKPAPFRAGSIYELMASQPQVVSPPVPSDCPETSEQHSTPQKPKRVEKAGYAFVDKQEASNLCGVAAINGFFQEPVITAKDVLKKMIDPYLAMFVSSDIEKLSGLFHPKVVEAMRQGKEITIGREEFLKQFASNLYDVSDQWRSFFNYTKAGASNREELIANAKQITLTPETWIACQGGLSMESLVNVINQQLEKESDRNQYPTCVDFLTISESQAPNQRRWLVDQLNNGTNNASRVICRTGSGSAGHYFALVKDPAGNWLKLDGLEANAQSGVREIVGDNKIHKDQLAVKLQFWNVSQVIADVALTSTFKNQFLA